MSRQREKPFKAKYKVELANYDEACKKSPTIKHLYGLIRKRYQEIKVLNRRIGRVRRRIWRNLSETASYQYVKTQKQLASEAVRRANRELARHNNYLKKNEELKFLEDSAPNWIKEANRERQLKDNGNTSTGQKNGHVQGPSQDGAGHDNDPVDQSDNQT